MKLWIHLIAVYVKLKSKLKFLFMSPLTGWKGY